jgi:hypothetical protein
VISAAAALVMQTETLHEAILRFRRKAVELDFDAMALEPDQTYFQWCDRCQAYRPAWSAKAAVDFTQFRFTRRQR